MASFQGTKINPSKFHISQIKFILIVIPIALIMLLPILFTISHAFKPIEELYAFPPKFFVSRPTLDNFRNLFEITAQSGIPFFRYVFNSVFVATCVVIITIVLSSATAFGLSKLEFKGRRVLLIANQIAIAFVAVAVAIPRFIIISALGVTNSYFAHMLPVLALPVGVFLLKQFIDQIPNELIEAAKIDGANKFHIYWRIVMPLIKPALATVAILAFQASWNNLETSQLFIDDESLKTLPYFLNNLILGSSNVAAQGMSAAASLVLFLPNIIFFIILQDKVMNTMAHSGIK